MNTFLSSNLTITDLNNVVYVPPGKGKPVHTNRPFYGLAYHSQGSYRYSFDNGTTSVSTEQCIIFLPKHSNYQVTATEKNCQTPCHCYAVNFDLSGELDCESFVFPLKDDTRFEPLFIALEKKWSEKHIGYHAKCMALLYEIISMMQNTGNVSYISGSQKEKLLAATEYIQSHYLTEEISIPYLASLCHMSETYFRKLFHSQYHVSPIKYINTLKIVRAKELILSEMYSVSDIATLSGFHDDCYFRKIFKRETSFSPNEFLKAHHKSN